MRDTGNAYQILPGKPEGNRQLGRRRHKSDDYIEKKWLRAFVNTAMNTFFVYGRRFRDGLSHCQEPGVWS
jgi:hypothetical protein